MDPARLARLADLLRHPEVRAIDPAGVEAIARGLEDADPPVTAGRGGALIAFLPGPRRRRALEFDRRGHLTAALRWREDGSLGWAKCLTADGRWIGLEPGAATHPAWGPSDRLWLLDESHPWAPRDELTVCQALDYARPDFIPPLWEPRRLPAGAGTAVLNLIAGLMKDHGVDRVRYRGPYPTEQLFTALLECFRYDPAQIDPLARFMDGAALDWLPAPHERHHVAPGVCVQLRHEIDKVVLDRAAFYRPDWQAVVRREPRVVRRDGERVLCSLWALDRPIEDRLVLDPRGEVLESPAPAPDRRPAASLAPVWRAALAELIARESAPALAGSIAEVMNALVLRWAPVPGDLLREEGGAGISLSTRLRDVGLDWIRRLPAGPERAAGGARFVLEIARLLGPGVRLRAQARLEAASEAAQRRALETGKGPTPELSDAVGRLVALVASGRA